MSQSTPAPRSPDALHEVPFDGLDEDTITTGVRYITPPDFEVRDTDVIPPRDTDVMLESGPDEETTLVMNDMSGKVRDALASRPLPIVEDPDGEIDFARILSTDPDQEDTGFPIDLADEKLEDDK